MQIELPDYNTISATDLSCFFPAYWKQDFLSIEYINTNFRLLGTPFYFENILSLIGYKVDNSSSQLIVPIIELSLKLNAILKFKKNEIFIQPDRIVLFAKKENNKYIITNKISFGSWSLIPNKGNHGTIVQPNGIIKEIVLNDTLKPAFKYLFDIPKKPDIYTLCLVTKWFDEEGFNEWRDYERFIEGINGKNFIITPAAIHKLKTLLSFVVEKGNPHNVKTLFDKIKFNQERRLSSISQISENGELKIIDSDIPDSI